MNSILRARRKSSVAAALISVLLGGVLITFPGTSILWLCMAMGAALLVTGVWYLIAYFRGRSMLSAFQLDLVLGIVLSVIGLWMLLRPETIIALIQYVFGAFILLHGVIDLQAALAIRRAGYPGWTGALIPSLLAIVLAVLILLDPFESLTMLVFLIGAVLIYCGIVELLLIFRLSRLFSGLEKEEAPGVIEADFTEADDPKDPGKGD